MTFTQVPPMTPAFTVTGMCGKTVHYNINGQIIAFTCSPDSGPDGGGGGEPPIDNGGEGGITRAGNPPGSSSFDSGSGGATAQTIRSIYRLSDEGRTDDHLLVMRPDGEIGRELEDYRGVLDAHQRLQGVVGGPVQIDLGDRVRAYLDHDIDEHAQPFVIVCPPTLNSIGADQLEPTLRAAAAAHAPVRLVTL
jgi:hypothetical protein